MSLVSIEIENDQLLVAASRSASRHVQIQHAFSIPVSGLTDEEIAEKLKSELGQRNLGRGDAIVVVSRASVEMREFVVPPAPTNELPDMVRFKARSEFASLNDNWQLDYIALAHDETVPRNVLAAGMSPEFNGQITKIVEGAGLKVKHVVLRPFASIELLNRRTDDNKCRLLVNPNGDQTDMTIVGGNQPIATRTVRIPESFDADQRTQSLQGEIKRTLASSRSSLGDRQVQEIVFFGDGDRNKNLKGALDSQLNVDVDFVDPFQFVKKASGLKLPEDVFRFASLTGALLNEESNSPHHIDFSNPRRPIEKVHDRSRIYLFGGLAVASMLLAVLFCWWTLRSQAQDIEMLRTQLENAQRVNSGSDGKYPDYDQIVGQVAKIDDWKMQDVNWLEELYQFSDKFLTPDDAIVGSLDAGLRRNGPEIMIRSNLVDFSTEETLIDSLDGRPYQIVPGKSSVDEQDPGYPLKFPFSAVLTTDRSELINDINKKTVEFLAARNLKVAGKAKEDAAPENTSELP
jgi:Tfp pilus assembly PilM family ATPase